MNRWSVFALKATVLMVLPGGFPGGAVADAGQTTTDCRIPGSGDSASVATAAVAFRDTLSSAQRIQLEQPLSHATAGRLPALAFTVRRRPSLVPALLGLRKAQCRECLILS